MIKRVVPFLAVQILAVSALSGCGWLVGDKGIIRDRYGDYRQSEVEVRTQVPEELDTVAIQDLYPIPGLSDQPQLEGKFKVPRPERVVTGAQGVVRAFKAGSRYWVTVTDEPAVAWGRVRQFWTSNDISLDAENPLEGTMETEWLKRKDESGKETRNRFRVRVEHGMREETAEIYIKHLGFDAKAELPDPATLDWGNVKAKDPLSTAMMQEIAGFLLETEYEGSSASLLAQSFVGDPKSHMGTDTAGGQMLVMDLDFSRAWEAVDKALEEAELEVEDKNRSAGTYYINYYPQGKPKKSRGFSLNPFRGKAKEKPVQKYQVLVVSEQEHIEVRVVGDEAQKNNEHNTHVLLETIRENLI